MARNGEWMKIRPVLSSVLALVLLGAVPAIAQQPDGAEVFAVQCATCHTPPGVQRAPMLETMRDRSPEAVVMALTNGTMALQGQDLTVLERHAVAEFITGRAVSADPIGTSVGGCESTPALASPLDGPHWTGWGVGPENRRFQVAEHAGLDVSEVPKLALKWAFGFPESTSAWAQPAVAGGRLFVGSQNGVIYALDAKTGCSHWTYAARGGVRTAISIGALGDDHAVFFGDTTAGVYALDAETGAELWTRGVESHPAARITGAPTLHAGRLYVPVSSVEEALAADSGYGCCTFRGSVVALDAATGVQIWKTYVIPEAPASRGGGPERPVPKGPAGAAIWSSPTIDASRDVVYVATGNAYTQPAAETSDAILALDLGTGEVGWTNQLTPDDAFIVGCRGDNPNCPEDEGPDHDFGASPALVTMTNGRDLLVIGQKSGMTYALDPDREGEVVWQYQAGAGSALGGIEWASPSTRTRPTLLCPTSSLRSPVACRPSVSEPASWSGTPSPLLRSVQSPELGPASSAGATRPYQAPSRRFPGSCSRGLTMAVFGPTRPRPVRSSGPTTRTGGSTR